MGVLALARALLWLFFFLGSVAGAGDTGADFGVRSLAQVVAQGPRWFLAAPSTAVALGTHAMHGHVDWRMGIPLALGGLLTFPGA